MCVCVCVRTRERQNDRCMAWGGVLSCYKEKLSRQFWLLSSPNVFQIKGMNYKALVVTVAKRYSCRYTRVIHPTPTHLTSLHYCADNVSNNKPSITQYEVTAVSGGFPPHIPCSEKKAWHQTHTYSTKILKNYERLSYTYRVQLSTELTNIVTGDLEGSNRVNVKAQRF
jgi:hypothetical protein